MKLTLFVLVLLNIILLITSLKIFKKISDIDNIFHDTEKEIQKYLNNINDPRQKFLIKNKINKYRKQNPGRKVILDDIFLDNTFFSNEYNIYPKNSKDFTNYRYFTYDEIIEKLNKYVLNNPHLIKVETAQSLYKLPNPVGDCNKKLCENFIITLGNNSIYSKNKEIPQMYISCALHGDEKVGPNLCIEFIELMLENYESSKWIKFLMDNRMIILTPMTNAYGYYQGMRV
jgi:hypothetical protein